MHGLYWIFFVLALGLPKFEADNQVLLYEQVPDPVAPKVPPVKGEKTMPEV